MTNTRILLDLCHPRLGDVIAVPPPLPLAAKNVIGRWAGPPANRNAGWGRGSGKSVYTGWPRFKIVLAVTLQWWGAVQDVQQAHLHKFISRSKKGETKK